jgi:hypothetical protein
MESTEERFNGLWWHDSKLLGVSVRRVDGEEQVVLSVPLQQAGESSVLTDVVFRNATYLRTEIDLDGKRACSGDISDAVCRSSSDCLKSLAERSPFDKFTGYLHFALTLIPSGGSIDVRATDFVLVAS